MFVDIVEEIPSKTPPTGCWKMYGRRKYSPRNNREYSLKDSPKQIKGNINKYIGNKFGDLSPQYNL